MSAADASSNVTLTSSTTTVPNPTLKATSDLTDSNLFIFGVGSLAVFVLLVLIFAIYKYRNRDEGTYRIDESKNCGPFAELHMPLNSDGSQRHGSSGGGGGGSKKKKSGVRQNNPNKEWLV